MPDVFDVTIASAYRYRGGEEVVVNVFPYSLHSVHIVGDEIVCELNGTGDAIRRGSCRENHWETY